MFKVRADCHVPCGAWQCDLCGRAGRRPALWVPRVASRVSRAPLSTMQIYDTDGSGELGYGWGLTSSVPCNFRTILGVRV